MVMSDQQAEIELPDTRGLLTVQRDPVASDAVSVHLDLFWRT